jgi:hypothetical protein
MLRLFIDLNLVFYSTNVNLYPLGNKYKYTVKHGININKQESA